jgi:hypothetical protein
VNDWSAGVYAAPGGDHDRPDLWDEGAYYNDPYDMSWPELRHDQPRYPRKRRKSGQRQQPKKSRQLIMKHSKPTRHSPKSRSPHRRQLWPT